AKLVSPKKMQPANARTRQMNPATPYMITRSVSAKPEFLRLPVKNLKSGHATAQSACGLQANLPANPHGQCVLAGVVFRFSHRYC
ncbi:MAG: hypothetical protein Q7R66_17290, partial [Undibacterium sp.]|uniref:hypothetical protein n=1 Tax=Undibacterium sp. TaxID=1914977 RepID=UPI0027164340